ncbi:MAG TPA: hypothetical protein VFT55_13995 [Planctomycetota bacterium]|nr:hypothetical protein [Planctomycetota bacterium]
MATRTPIMVLGLAALLPCQQDEASTALAAARKAPAAEPKYEGKPRYLLLALGQPIEHTVWCVIDGMVLYVDRDCDGRLDASNERVKPIVSRLNDDHFIAETHTYKVGALQRVQGPAELELTLKQWNPEYQANADLAEVMAILRANPALRNPMVTLKRKGKPEQFAMTEFAESPATATVLHFDAPTTWGVVENIVPDRFTAAQEYDFEVSLGTPGLGAWSFVYTRSLERTDLRPEIDVVFEVAGGGKPITAHHVLPEWC